MRAGKQLCLVGIALLVLFQAATARPWLSRTSLADSRLSGLQEQLRQNQLRRLTTVDDKSEYEVGRSSNAGRLFGAQGYCSSWVRASPGTICNQVLCAVSSDHGREWVLNVHRFSQQLGAQKDTTNT